MNDHLEFLHLFFLRFASALYRKKKHGKKKMSIVEEDEEDSGITIKVKFIHHQKKIYIRNSSFFTHYCTSNSFSRCQKKLSTVTRAPLLT